MIETFEAYRILPAALVGWLKRQGERGPVYATPSPSFRGKPGEVVLSVSGPGDACSNMRFLETQVVKVNLRRTRIPAGAGLYDIVLEEVLACPPPLDFGGHVLATCLTRLSEPASQPEKQRLQRSMKGDHHGWRRSNEKHRQGPRG